MNTDRYVVDSWAWIEYLDGTGAGAKVKSYIEKGTAYTSVVSIAEIVSKAARSGKDPNIALSAILSSSKVVDCDSNFAKDAGLLHADMKRSRSNFSLADAFALHTARSLHAKVLTGDPDFKDIADAILIKR